MIVDRIDRRDVYNNFVPNWKEAFDFALSLKDADPGRYECESLRQELHLHWYRKVIPDHIKRASWKHTADIWMYRFF